MHPDSDGALHSYKKTWLRALLIPQSSGLDILMQMRQAFAIFFFLGSLTTGSLCAHAQVVPAARGGQISITAGGMASVFQPDYAGGGVPSFGPDRLYGLGGYVDVRFNRWIQAEAEGRWLKFNQFDNIQQSNYLLGPRVPIHRFGRFTPYGKVLFGFTNMTFEYNVATGRYTTIAYGGGVDIKLTRRITLRAFDFEYQQWPTWYNNQTLTPFGGSVGASYRIF
jgi:opacity protein-like surface antigen